MNDFVSDLEPRFLRYVQINTESDEAGTGVPSTACQFDLLKLLQAELQTMGATNVQLTDNGFVVATIPATAGVHDAPKVAFLAHVDTSAAFSGAGVKPLVHRRYDGTPIVLPDDPSQRLSPEINPYLGQKIGDDIVTASGTTLLGADDKAGVAIVMTMAAHLLAHPAIPHGEIRVCFTPDEEIGTGIGHLDLATLGADVAYTLDGAECGQLVSETFSADKGVVHITGVSTHPGSAFGELVNALHLAGTIITTLPHHTRTPETTTGRDGFIHLYRLEGSAAHAELGFILRDFDAQRLHEHGEILRTVCSAVQATEPRAQIACTITPQYRNMHDYLKQDMRPVEKAKQAMRAVGIESFMEPIRGGTDGSILTERGVPTPNLFTGMQNIHGPLEWVSLQDMSRAVEVCVELAQEWTRP
ncbi:MAG: peptidase T [Herpetosiphon sp.]